MRIPESLATLAEYGIISEVERSLMSGKEAEVYLVIAGGERRVAKIYKDAQNRTFKHRADYTEGRKTRNTRDQRAIGKRSAHGRAKDEASWRETEVNMIYRLQEAGVRVPAPYHFIDGVLVMELVLDAYGEPAPRLGDVPLDREQATAIYQQLIQEVVRMLCSGVVHGDLSDFNVLLGAQGPVLIDFPQSVDPAHNPNARKLLLRDVDNLHDFLARHDRNAPRPPYAEEMWDLYQSNRLSPDTKLTGNYRSSTKSADTASVMALIDDAKRDERRRRDALGIKGGPQEPPRAPRPQHDRRPQQARPQQQAQQAQPRQQQQPRQQHASPSQHPSQHPSPQQHRPPNPNRQSHPTRQPNPNPNRSPNPNPQQHRPAQPQQHRPAQPQQHRPPHAQPQRPAQNAPGDAAPRKNRRRRRPRGGGAPQPKPTL